MLTSYPFDYVIGSVHYIDGWGFDNPDLTHEYEHRSLFEIYTQYFEQLCASARSGLFDIIAHPDLIKKFGYRLPEPPFELYRGAVLAFAEAGVCVELNTAGLRAAAAEMYPSREFLAACRKEGIPVTTGSDAHRPEQVGWGFDLALELLRDVGYKEIVHFKGREKTFIRI
jgi:histidinol-phosphatase (PHP family)